MDINSKDFAVLERTAAHGVYGVGSALGDMTGFGTCYNMGADLAHRNSLSRIADTKDSAFNDYVQAYLTSTKRSLAGKAGYLGCGTAAAAGACLESGWLLSLGAIGMALFAAIFMARAGLNESDTTLRDIQMLKETSK